MAFKIVRPSGRTDGYEAPNLFPEFHKFGASHRRRAYVETRLVQMARENSLYLTDVLNQSQPIWTMAGMVILGQAVEENKLVTGKRVESELRNYQVHVKSLCSDTVKWCRDMVPGEPIIKGRATLADGNDMPLSNFRVIEEWVDTEQTDVKLELPDAWMCLRQYGKHCRPAKRPGLQEKYWLYEEVRPEGKVEIPEDEPKRKKTTFAEANRA